MKGQEKLLPTGAARGSIAAALRLDVVPPVWDRGTDCFSVLLDALWLLPQPAMQRGKELLVFSCCHRKLHVFAKTVPDIPRLCKFSHASFEFYTFLSIFPFLPAYSPDFHLSLSHTWQPGVEWCTRGVRVTGNQDGAGRGGRQCLSQDAFGQGEIWGSEPGGEMNAFCLRGPREFPLGGNEWEDMWNQKCREPWRSARARRGEKRCCVRVRLAAHKAANRCVLHRALPLRNIQAHDYVTLALYLSLQK